MVDKHVLYNIIKIIAFLTILLMLVLGIQREFIPFRFQDTIQARTFANYTEEDSVDVLIVGTSSIMVGISPLFIAQYNYQKLQSEMENIASPKWRKLQRIF